VLLVHAQLHKKIGKTMVIATAPVYVHVLYPAKCLEDAYWEKIEECRGVAYGSNSEHGGELAIRVFSVAHAIFQAAYAVFAMLPVLVSSIVSLYRHHDGNLAFDEIFDTAFLTMRCVWAPTICAAMVVVDPAQLDKPEYPVRRRSNQLLSHLLFLTS
jgi:hypothetical protein